MRRNLVKESGQAVFARCNGAVKKVLLPALGEAVQQQVGNLASELAPEFVSLGLIFIRHFAQFAHELTDSDHAFNFGGSVIFAGTLERKETHALVNEFQMVGKTCFNQNFL